MSKYDDDKAVRAAIDKINKEINESLYPIMNGTDCTVKEYRACSKREKELKREVKLLDKEYYDTVFDF